MGWHQWQLQDFRRQGAPLVQEGLRLCQEKGTDFYYKLLGAMGG